MPLTADLAQLESWLAQHAPANHASLLPPAADDDIAALSTAVGRALHPDLVDLLRWHGGTTNGPSDALQIAPDFGFLNVADAAEEWQGNVLRLDGFPTDIEPTWQPHWVPIGIDWSGGTLAVDHDDTGDHYGRVFATEPEQGPYPGMAWPSLSHLISDLVYALDNMSPLRDYSPTITEGAVVWE